MLILITTIVCGFFGFSMGKMSNGMTSPRMSFNIWISPFSAIIGAVIGLFATIFGGSLGTNVLSAALVGGIAGAATLGFARLLRRFGR
jgi:hypothetical protein